MTDTKHSADLPPLPDDASFCTRQYSADQMHAYARAAIAAAAPAGEPVAWADPQALANFVAAKVGSNQYHEWMWAGPDAGLIPLYAAPVPAAAPDHSLPTDISKQLREYANNPGYSHNDYADTMRTAADECERFYGGMMNWKKTAQAKDKTIIELREQLAAIPAAAPKAALTDERIANIKQSAIEAWNASADEMNQWDDLGRDEQDSLFARRIEAASGPNAALVEALQGALAVIDDYLAYRHNGDPWVEDARLMGEMDINDYERDGRLEMARAALAAAGARP